MNPNPASRSDIRHNRASIAIFIGIILLAVVGTTLVIGRSGPRSEQPAPRSPRSAVDIAQPHLDLAEQEANSAIDEQVKQVNAFFAEAKKNSPAFAERALGWGSRRRWLQDFIPFGKQDAHKEFLQAKFEEYLFKREHFEAVVRQIVQGYLRQVASSEGKMLVGLRADVADFTATYALASVDENRLQEVYESALHQIVDSTGERVQKKVGEDTVEALTADVLTFIALRLGVRAGILAAGAASAPATFGVSVIVGLIVDQIVTYIWEGYSNPTGDLTEEVDRKLDEMQRLVVDGPSGTDGLGEQLRKHARDRAEWRRQSVLILLQPPTGRSE